MVAVAAMAAAAEEMTIAEVTAQAEVDTDKVTPLPVVKDGNLKFYSLDSLYFSCVHLVSIS